MFIQILYKSGCKVSQDDDEFSGNLSLNTLSEEVKSLEIKTEHFNNKLFVISFDCLCPIVYQQFFELLWHHVG